MERKTSYPRRNLFVAVLCLLALCLGGLYVYQFVLTDDSKADAHVACADRKPAKAGEVCTDTIAFRDASATRHYVAKKNANAELKFDESTLTLSVNKITLDNFCAAEAIASVRPDKPTVELTAEANREQCDKIRGYTINPAYDADFHCEYEMRNLQSSTFGTFVWKRVIADYFTEEAIDKICSTPLPSSHGEPSNI